MLIHDDIPLHFDPRSTDLFRRRRPDPLHLSIELPNRFREAEGAGLLEPEEEPDPWTTRDKLVALATFAVIGFAGFVLGTVPS